MSATVAHPTLQTTPSLVLLPLSQVLGSMRLPGQGCYTYSAIVQEYLRAILHIASGSFVSERVANRQQRAHTCHLAG